MCVKTCRLDMMPKYILSIRQVFSLSTEAIMTFKELQQEFQLARTTAYDLVRRKDFPAIKDTSGTWIINEKNS